MELLRGKAMRAATFCLHMRRLMRDREGNFAVLGAIAFIPIIGAAALAIDFAGAYFEAEKIQSALDAAALGSVRAYGEGATEEEAYDAAQKFFWSNYALPQESVVDALSAATEASTQALPRCCRTPICGQWCDQR